MFVYGGWDAYQHPESKVKAAEAVTKPLSSAIDVVPDDATALIRLNGAVQIGAGVLLSLGRFRRLAALALIGSIIPTTYAGHRFWEEVDEERRAQQQIHFLKNLGLLGGLVAIATEPRSSQHATQRRSKRSQRKQAAKAAARSAGRKAVAAQHQTADTARSLQHQTADTARHLLAQAEDVIAQNGPRVSEVAGHLVSSGVDMASTLVNKAGEHLQSH
jgi:putative oxidoreductase